MASSTPPENGAKQIKVDISEWGKSMEGFTDWNEAANSGGFAKMHKLLARVVREMPYEGDVADPDTYRTKLTPKQYKEVTAEVNKAIGVFFKDYEIEISKAVYKAGKFKAQTEAKIAHKIARVRLAQEFGWTLEYIDTLDPYTLSEIWGVLDGQNKLNRPKTKNH